MVHYCLPDYSRAYSRRATDPRRATCDSAACCCSVGPLTALLLSADVCCCFRLLDKAMERPSSKPPSNYGHSSLWDSRIWQFKCRRRVGSRIVVPSVTPET